jgi:hypothetical protein
MGEIVGVHYSTIREYLGKYDIPYTPDVEERGQKSIAQMEIEDFVASHGVEFISCDRSLDVEMDVYIQHKNFAIEYNGLYHHSSLIASENYHKRKFDILSSNGISLLIIGGDDWQFRRDACESRILHGIGLSKRVHARKCSVQIVDNDVALNFYNQNHIHRTDFTGIHYGLVYCGELYCIITIEANDGTRIKNGATKNGYTVVGGTTKLLSTIKRLHGNKIECAVDNTCWNGISLVNGGMLYGEILPPRTYWTDKVRVYREGITETESKRLTKYGNPKYVKYSDAGATIMKT